MSLKEKIQDNLVLSVLGIVVTAFAAGFGAHAAVQSAAGVIPTGRAPLDQAFVKTQLDKLTVAHIARVEQLQKALMDNEREAGNLGHLDQYRRDYVDAAKPAAEALAEENQSYLAQMQALIGTDIKPGERLGNSGR